MIKPAGFIEERDEGLRLRLHLLPERAVAESGVAFKADRAHRAFLAFVNRVSRARRAAAFIRRHLQLHVHAGETFALVEINDVLAAFLKFLRVRGRRDPELDFISQCLGFKTLRAIDLDLGHQRPGGEDDLHMDAVALGLAEDADVLDFSGVVKCANVVFHRRLGIGRADFGPHVGKHAILGNGLGADVAHVD